MHTKITIGCEIADDELILEYCDGNFLNISTYQDFVVCLKPNSIDDLITALQEAKKHLI